MFERYWGLDISLAPSISIIKSDDFEQSESSDLVLA